MQMAFIEMQMISKINGRDYQIWQWEAEEKEMVESEKAERR